MRTSLFWYTKDLRVDDLPALAEACVKYDAVIPIYIWDDAHLEDEADNRKAFLIDSLIDLDNELRKRGSGLGIYRGETVTALAELCQTQAIKDVYFTASRDPATKQLQTAVTAGLQAHGIQVHLSSPNFLLDPDSIKTKTDGVYRVFTPFKNAVLQHLKLREEVKPPRNLVPADGEFKIPQFGTLSCSPERQKGGASEAKLQWQNFKRNGVKQYGEARNDLANEHGTSKLSAHLNFGTISVNSIARDLLQSEASSPFINELIWREFNSYIAHHFPEVLHRAFREELTFIDWPGKQEHLEAWKAGETGYPLVDAAMRQLMQTGWMHNRARMIVASFLVKDLLIDWQEGEAHFMEWLTDGDQVQNNAGWQWSSSTGVDAQPYFRIFNPITQGKKFDPKGEYIRRYVPELRDRPDSLIHQINVQDRSGYPMAIVNHATQREKALAMFKNAMTNFRK
jgi:deoxyribodipyrimidine photo-lyase